MKKRSVWVKHRNAHCSLETGMPERLAQSIWLSRLHLDPNLAARHHLRHPPHLHLWICTSSQGRSQHIRDSSRQTITTSFPTRRKEEFRHDERQATQAVHVRAQAPSSHRAQPAFERGSRASSHSCLRGQSEVSVSLSLAATGRSSRAAVTARSTAVQIDIASLPLHHMTKRH